MKSPALTRPEIRFFAGLWTLRDYPSSDAEWPVERKFEEVKAAGFEGIGGKFIDRAPALCDRLGLDYVLYIDAGLTGFHESFRRAVDYSPKRINVQLANHDTAPDAAADAWCEIAAFAGELGLQVDLELHRDTATETPEKARAIAERVLALSGKPVRWSLDHSHFAVVKHLMPPYAPRLLDPVELAGGIRQMHFRPFNGHHCQIPATDGSGNLTDGFGHYLEFVEELLSLWLTTAPSDAVLYVCPENGPKAAEGYALPCFPDVWKDAIVVRDQVRKLWDRLASPR